MSALAHRQRPALARLVLALPCAALLLAPLACAGTKAPSCTEMGCMNSLSIQLTKLSPWAAGSYSVTIKHDDAQVDCAVVFPLDCDAPPACGDEDVFLGLSGCALDPAEQSISSIDFMRGTPAKVSISVRLGEGESAEGLGDAEFAPTYRSSRPNGPECEPECNTAVEQLVMKIR